MKGYDKHNQDLIMIIGILVLIIIGLGIYIFYDKGWIFSSNRNDVNEIEENTVPIEEEQQNLSYKIGDVVILKNSTLWNVMEESPESNDFVTLLSSENINDGTIVVNNAENYVTTTYKNKLQTELNASNSDILESRLLTLEDVGILSGIATTSLQIGTTLENNITPQFLYKQDTITNFFNKNNPVMVCSPIVEYRKINSGRLCLGIQTGSLPIRPVIKISKKYIQSI